MTSKQLSDRIGNIDDRLVQQAEQRPNNSRQSQIQKRETVIMRQKKGFRSLVAVAAVIALMVCSFCVGAVAFAKEVVVEVPKEVIVEVPVEQEAIEIEEIGLTLILPDSWKGKYAFEQDDDFKEYYVYNPSVREAMGGSSETLSSGGMLFYIKLWDEQLTKDQVDAGGEWSYAKCQYIMTTQNGTYLLYYASDVQFTPETETEYRQMEDEISDIRFVVDNALK